MQNEPEDPVHVFGNLTEGTCTDGGMMHPWFKVLSLQMMIASSKGVFHHDV